MNNYNYHYPHPHPNYPHHRATTSFSKPYPSYSNSTTPATKTSTFSNTSSRSSDKTQCTTFLQSIRIPISNPILPWDDFLDFTRMKPPIPSNHHYHYNLLLASIFNIVQRRCYFHLHKKYVGNYTCVALFFLVVSGMFWSRSLLYAFAITFLVWIVLNVMMVAMEETYHTPYTFYHHHHHHRKNQWITKDNRGTVLILFAIVTYYLCSALWKAIVVLLWSLSLCTLHAVFRPTPDEYRNHAQTVMATDGFMDCRSAATTSSSSPAQTNTSSILGSGLSGRTGNSTMSVGIVSGGGDDDDDDNDTDDTDTDSEDGEEETIDFTSISSSSSSRNSGSSGNKNHNHCENQSHKIALSHIRHRHGTSTTTSSSVSMPMSAIALPLGGDMSTENKCDKRH